MTLEDSPDAHRNLGFRPTIRAAFAAVFGQFRRFVTLAALPCAASLLLAVTEIPAVLSLPSSELAFLVVRILPFAVLGVALNRAILLDQTPGLLPRPLVGRRTWKYFGYSLLLLLILLVPFLIILVVVLGASVLAGMGAQPAQSVDLGLWGVFGGLLTALALLYAAARLSLVFPAIAVDEKLGFAGSWKLSRGGRGLKLSAVLISVSVVLFVLGSVFSMIIGQPIRIGTGVNEDVILYEGMTAGAVIMASLPNLVLSTLLSHIGAGLLTGAYASAFAQLADWGHPHEEILERFE